MNGLRIIDRGRQQKVLEGRLAFIRSMVEAEMRDSQAPAHLDHALRIAELSEKFNQVRSRLTLGEQATSVAQDVDQAIREKQSNAIHAQVSMEVKKLLDLI